MTKSVMALGNSCESSPQSRGCGIFQLVPYRAVPCLYEYESCTVRVIYQAPRSRVRVDTAGEDESEPQARTSTSWPDPPVHGDEGPDINRVVWSEMNATASGLYGS